ncbi:right-handed parallel beta-helix repeat-containing protein [Actinomadura fulvescens]|uniref:Right handed beta helix domain-containing protein n=1 Tax=Actinomadura fulvescens TaxID=46160 RepID=A0ABN3Q136_9ACTN
MRRAISLITIALVLIGLVTPPASAAVVTPPVASDCSTDVTSAFNSWLAGVPDGSTISLAANGCYLSNGTFLFVGRRNLTILGNGATIKASGAPACPPGATRNAKGYCVVPNKPDGSCPTDTTRTGTGECVQKVSRQQLRFVRGGGFVVRNVTLQGSNFTPDCAVPPPAQYSCYDALREGDGNLHVFGSDGVLIDNVRFKNAWDDAVTVAPIDARDGDGTGALIPRNVTVQNSTVDTAGRHAFTCIGCRDFVIRDNTVTNVGYWGVDVEISAKTWTGDLVLERNRFSNIYAGVVVVTPNLPPSTLGQIVVRDNVRTDAPVFCMFGIVIGRDDRSAASGVTVTGNRIRAVAGGAVVRHALEAKVADNTFEVDRSVPCAVAKGVVFSKVSSGSVIGNTILNTNQPFEIVTSNVTVCGNRTTPTGAFTQPVPCSEPSY